MAGAHTQPLLWLRLAQACLSSVWKARGSWQPSTPDNGSEAQAQAQQLMFAGCCLQNTRMLSDQPPPERPGADGERLTAPTAQWCVQTQELELWYRNPLPAAAHLHVHAVSVPACRGPQTGQVRSTPPCCINPTSSPSPLLRRLAFLSARGLQSLTAHAQPAAQHVGKFAACLGHLADAWAPHKAGHAGCPWPMTATSHSTPSPAIT